jgi:hypothetical protein
LPQRKTGNRNIGSKWKRITEVLCSMGKRRYVVNAF